MYTNSLAILSEALHSGLDLLSALMAWYAIRVFSQARRQAPCYEKPPRLVRHPDRADEPEPRRRVGRRTEKPYV